MAMAVRPVDRRAAPRWRSTLLRLGLGTGRLPSLVAATAATLALGLQG
jgi:hypothetical protein